MMDIILEQYFGNFKSDLSENVLAEYSLKGIVTFGAKRVTYMFK